MPIYELACEGGHRSETLQPSTAPLPPCGLRRGDPQGPQRLGVAGTAAVPPPRTHAPDLEGHPPGRPRLRHPPAPDGRPAATWRPATPSWPPTVAPSSPTRAGSRGRRRAGDPAPPRPTGAGGAAGRGRRPDHRAGRGPAAGRGGRPRRVRAAAGRVLDRRLAVPGAARAGGLPANPTRSRPSSPPASSSASR